MRLFLASQDLGNYANVLKGMVGERKRAFVISNARDYYQNEMIISQKVEKSLRNLNKIGIEAELLDLKKYFDKPVELKSLIANSNIGLIFLIGGSVICLATAMHLSGMDDIIWRGVLQNDFVYGAIVPAQWL